MTAPAMPAVDEAVDKNAPAATDQPTRPAISGQLLPSRSLRALKAVLDRQHRAVA